MQPLSSHTQTLPPQNPLINSLRQANETTFVCWNNTTRSWSITTNPSEATPYQRIFDIALNTEANDIQEAISLVFSSIEQRTRHLIQTYNSSKDNMNLIDKTLNSFNYIYSKTNNMPWIRSTRQQIRDNMAFYLSISCDFREITRKSSKFTETVAFFGPKKNYCSLSIDTFKTHGIFSSQKEWNRRIETCYSNHQAISDLSKNCLKRKSELITQFIKEIEHVRLQIIPTDSNPNAEMSYEADILEAYSLFHCEYDLFDWEPEQRDLLINAINLDYLIPFTKNQLEGILLRCKQLDSTRLNRQSNELEPLTKELVEKNTPNLIFILSKFSVYCTYYHITYLKREQADLFNLMRQVYKLLSPWVNLSIEKREDHQIYDIWMEKISPSEHQILSNADS